MDYWKDKIAVVTGASSGIGAQITVELAKAGITVIGLARRKDLIEQLINENPDTTGKIYARTCDISDAESIKLAFQWIEGKFNKIHILINNAGCIKNGNILEEELSNNQITAVINTNFTGLVLCTREGYRLMKNHQDLGYIINMNSVLGHLSFQSKFGLANVYASTKHAVANHTDNVRLFLASKDVKRVRIASVSPGTVKTDIGIASGFSKEVNEKIFEKSVHLLPKDVSDAIMYLLSLPPNVNVTELTIKSTGELF